MIAVWALGQSDGSSTRLDEPPIKLGASKQVTTEDGLEIDPALSPDGKMLAYAAGPVMRMRIYTRAVAGGRANPLSDGSAPLEFQPRWSPDGSQILYLSAGAVRVATGLGGASRPIAAGGVTAAAWSPNGKEILVVRGAALSVAPIDAGVERPLGQAPDAVYSCDWSLQGDRIACASGNRDGVVPGRGFGNIAPSRIVMMPVSGGTTVEIALDAGLNQSPAWAPDGRELYFVSDRQGARDVYAVGISPDGRVEGEPRRVTTGLGAISIALSADGRHLAYATYAMRANIWTLPIPRGGPVDASNARPLTSGNQIVEAMRVSRDERWLLYDSTLKSNADIYRMPVGGGQPDQLTTDPAHDFVADLSPDGRSIVFHSFRLGTRDIFVQSVDGGAPQPVAASKTSEESGPVWSPDGNAIAFYDQAVEGGETRGLFVVRRGPSGEWGTPAGLRRGIDRPSWLDERTLVYHLRDGMGIETISVDGGSPRVIYAPAPNSADPPAFRVVPSEDGRTVYFMSRDVEGRASLWSIPVAGGKPRPLVRFSDLSRPSVRPEFAAGAGQFFFRFEDRQADISVVEVTRRVK